MSECDDGGSRFLLLTWFDRGALHDRSDGGGSHRRGVRGLGVCVSGDIHALSNSVGDDILPGSRYCTARGWGGSERCQGN